MWKKAVGSKNERPRINGGLVRKSFTTTVHGSHPHMKSDLAVTLNLDVSTATKSYWIPEKIETASRTATKMQRIMRGECDPDKDQGLTEDEVLRLFSHEDQINLEMVKTKLMENNILGTFSPKKICNELRYRREKERDAQPCQLPAEEESANDRLTRIGIVPPGTPSLVGTEPFTEAGSSVKRAPIQLKSWQPSRESSRTLLKVTQMS